MVVGIGEALWDVLPEGKKLGGAPANFAYHVKQFGLDSVAVSAIGKDDLGDEIEATFQVKGVDYDLSRVDYPTGTVLVEVDATGIPCYDIKENVAWDNIPFSEKLQEFARRTRAVCFGSLGQRNEVSRSTIRAFLDAMGETAGKLVVFDVNLRQHFYDKEVLEESFRRCNVLKINDEELVEIARMFGLAEESEEAVCRHLVKEYGLKMLILTCGVKGSYVFTPESVSFQATPKVEVADTVGAGDSFTAAFIANILKGRSVEEAHKKAVETSAFVCTQYGAMPELPPSITD